MLRAFMSLVLLCRVAIASAQPQPLDFAALIAAHETGAEAPLLAREALLGRAPVEQVLLSPDGRVLAYAEREGPALRLKLLHTEEGTIVELFSVAELRQLHWIPDSRHLLLELDHAVGYLAVDDPARASYITLLDRAKGDYFLGPDTAAPGQVLVVRRENAAFVLQRWSLAGESQTLFEGPESIRALSMPEGDALFLQLMDSDSHSIYLFENGAKELIVSCGVLDQCAMEAYDASTRTLWLRADLEENLAALYAWSRDSGALRLVHTDPWQLSSLFGIAFIQGEPLLAQYHDQRTRSYALQADAQRQLAMLDARFPQSNLSIQPSAGAYWLISEEGATLHDARHYLLDTSSGALHPVLERANTAPAPAQLAAKHFFQYPAADGLLLNGYLSLPKGRNLRETPLVAWVHGGPQSRFLADYSPYVQVLVNRGYAVFEANFRASTGFGRSYMTAAEKDFGKGTVQQDILDGLDYLLAQGIGDPERQAIAGASFGGFAVLTALAFTPARFRAGVAFVPPAELGESARFLASQPRFGMDAPMQAELLRVSLVDLDDPAELSRLRENSPLMHLNAIAAPLLVMAGGRDDAVDINHVKDYTLALQRLGKPLQLLIDPDEGHAFRSRLARQASLYALEGFLAPHLGGRVEGPDEELRRYLDAITRIGLHPPSTAAE